MARLDLRGKTAVITGAGSGIGRALAVGLAARGCHLALSDIRPATLEPLAAELAPRGLRISCHTLDVADRTQVAAFPEVVATAHPSVDLLFNNAGVALAGRFDEVSEQDFEWLLSINFHGLVRMTRAFLPVLKQRPEAHLVNIASLFSLVSPAGQTAYCASKFAVRGFSDALRHELDGSTVGVSVVCPGGVATRIAVDARVGHAVDTAALQTNLQRAARLLSLPADKAAETILQGVERRKPRILVGNDAKAGAFLERLMPIGYYRLMRGLLGD
jgi:short-subunit dehydrogenase